MNAFETGYKGLISGLFFIVALVLLLLSGSSTTFLIGDWTEKVFLTYDAAWRNVLYLAVFTLAMFGLREWQVSEMKTFSRMQAGLLGFGTALTLLWTVNNRVIPEQDQLFVFGRHRGSWPATTPTFCGAGT